MSERTEIIYLSLDEAQNLVDRIAERIKDFNHTMCENEKESMANLLSDMGVLVSDLIDVSRLADNYAINAEIVTQEERDQYGGDLDEYLFAWISEDGTETFCMSW